MQKKHPTTKVCLSLVTIVCSSKHTFAYMGKTKRELCVQSDRFSPKERSMHHDKWFLLRKALKLSTLILFAILLSCEEYDDPWGEDWDDEELDERATARKSGCEGKCSSSCQCSWTEVGCSADRDCQTGLYCKIRPQLGNRCLKKQSNGGDNNDNTGDCHEFKPGHGSYCSSSCKCNEGEGDCDNDSQCKPGLVCKQQTGTDFCVKSGGGGDDSGGGGSDNGGGGNGDLKIVIFSVGSADSTLIVFPTGKTMLVDSATDGKCQKVVLPFLKRHGIRHLDYYLETHPHQDHSGGAGVLRNSGHIDSRTKKWDWNTYDYKDQFQLEKTKWFIANARDTSFHGSDANENSVAFRMEYNGFVYTAGGDEGTASQNRFLSGYPNLVKAHVRNTAHHMWGPVSKSFLVKTNPFMFVTSCYSRGDLPSAYRSAVSTLKKSGRLKQAVITGDSNVGHVAIRASSGSNWNHKFCGSKSACVVDFL